MGVSESWNKIIFMFSKFQSLPSYFGGKRKLVKYIFKPIKKTEGVFIDAFLGGGSVSLYAKAKRIQSYFKRHRIPIRNHRSSPYLQQQREARDRGFGETLSQSKT